MSRVADDVVTIPPEQEGDAAIMLAASHALAQSTKVWEQKLPLGSFISFCQCK